MVIIFTFIIFLSLFLLLVEFFSILFKLTGLSYEKARFQVISLLTNTGYTTKESELIVQHPTRRKLASWLIIISYVSTATFISFVVKIITDSLLNPKTILIIFIFFIIVFSFRKTGLLLKFENSLENKIGNTAFWNNINPKYISLIFKAKGYGVYEIYLPTKNFLVGKSILDSKLTNLEIQVLNIDKGDKLINFPTPDYIFESNDKITVYGNIKKIHKLFN